MHSPNDSYFNDKFPKGEINLKEYFEIKETERKLMIDKIDEENSKRGIKILWTPINLNIEEKKLNKRNCRR